MNLEIPMVACAIAALESIGINPSEHFKEKGLENPNSNPSKAWNIATNALITAGKRPQKFIDEFFNQ